MRTPNPTPIKDTVMYWNNLVYSDPGAGKTVLTSTDNKVFILVTETDGIMSAQTFGKGSPAEHEVIEDWEHLIGLIEYWEKNPETLKKWEVLGIDSLTEMQRLAKEYSLKVSAPEKIRKDQDHTRMQIQDYGIMHEELEGAVRRLNDLPINVFYTATAKKVEDPDGLEFLVPDLQGKKEYGIALKMAALMTSYGYLRVENHDVPAGDAENPEKTKTVKRRVIYWEDTGTIRGKDRTNKLRPHTVNATLQQIRLAIAGKMVRDSEGRIVKPARANDKPVVSEAPKKVAAQASPTPDKPVESNEKPKEDAADVTLETVEA